MARKSVLTGGDMKDAIDSLPADRPVEAEGFANRKLIRPSLARDGRAVPPSLDTGGGQARPRRNASAQARPTFFGSGLAKSPSPWLHFLQ